jgi:hypothetical protein
VLEISALYFIKYLSCVNNCDAAWWQLISFAKINVAEVVELVDTLSSGGSDH